MRTKIRLLMIVFVLVFGLCGSPLFAEYVDVYGNTPYAGTLDSEDAGALVTGWANSDWDGKFSIEWNITDMGGYYQYNYTITSPDPILNHFILEVSDGFNENDRVYIYNSIDSDLNANITLDYGVEDSSWYSPNPSPQDWKFSQSITFYSGFTIKEEEQVNIIKFTFNSLQEPVWGDFYAKGGDNCFAYNKGLTAEGGAKIGTIDTTVVPLPATILLGFIGLGVGGWKLRRKMV